jgi:hypothetical protein
MPIVDGTKSPMALPEWSSARVVSASVFSNDCHDLSEITALELSAARRRYDGSGREHASVFIPVVNLK